MLKAQSSSNETFTSVGNCSCYDKLEQDCNRTPDHQIPLRSHLILFITRMITHQIGLHSALLPSLITLTHVFLLK